MLEARPTRQTGEISFWGTQNKPGGNSAGERILNFYQSIYFMFGLGFSEVVVVLIVALIFLGPEKLPDVARTLGRTLGEFRRALDELKHEIQLTDDAPTTPAIPGGRLAPSALKVDHPTPPDASTSPANCETQPVNCESEKKSESQ